MRDKFLDTIENANTKRSYVTIFNSAKKYEDKYNCLLENFDKFMLLDFMTNEFQGVSRCSVSVKISYLRKYMAYVGNNVLEEFVGINDTLLKDKSSYIKLDEIIELCEVYLLNASDKALIMLLYHGIKGKSELSELRMLKTKDVNINLRTITLSNRVVTIENEYTLNVLEQTMKEKYYYKYLEHENVRTNKAIKYNDKCEYLFKSNPNKRNNYGLNPYSFSALTSKLFRFSNMFNTTVQYIYQSGICNIVNDYQKKLDRDLTIIEINFYLKTVLKLESITSSEIYNMLKSNNEKKEVEST